MKDRQYPSLVTFFSHVNCLLSEQPSGKSVRASNKCVYRAQLSPKGHNRLSTTTLDISESGKMREFPISVPKSVHRYRANPYHRTMVEDSQVLLITQPMVRPVTANRDGDFASGALSDFRPHLTARPKHLTAHVSIRRPAVCVRRRRAGCASHRGRAVPPWPAP